MKPLLTFRTAVAEDALAIVQLINTSYRGDASRAGWTTEADILDGLRTTLEEINALICAKNKKILLCINNNEIIGSICLEKIEKFVQFGMFVVNPRLQGGGIGKQLLFAAEELAQKTWDCHQFQMLVISIRHELIAFYERRGFKRTGKMQAFPLNPSLWQPKLAHLQLEVLEKQI